MMEENFECWVNGMFGIGSDDVKEFKDIGCIIWVMFEGCEYELDPKYA